MKSNYSLKLLAIAMVASISFHVMHAQTRLCGTDIMTEKLLAEHPELLEKYAESETYTQNYVQKLEAQKRATHAPHRAASSTGPLYIIPIVFHIMHQNGPENISDAQIMDEMRILNEDWGRTNPDTADAVTSHFRDIEGNMRVEFRLAKIDPNGNCTNGIDRIYTNLTNNAGDLVKLDDWDRSKYLNVWVCKAINSSSAGSGTILGYAYFPFEVDNDPAVDGVLIANYCVGSIGTGDPQFSRCLSHEIGHVMNLEHPFGISNSAGVVGKYMYTPGAACGDDGVEDTPNTRGFYSYCPTGGGNDDTGPINLADTIYAQICDTTAIDTVGINLVTGAPVLKYVITVENFQNFMDYSACSMMFTEDQQERVWAALNSAEAQRNNLWDTANLIATGVLDKNNQGIVVNPPASECAPVANFYSNTCLVCQGASIHFYDNSTNATPTNWLWSFTGATSSTSTQENPTVTFDSLYGQTVALTVSDSMGQNTKTQYNYIHVSPPWTTYYGTFSEGFENPAEVNTNWIFLNKFNNGTNWQCTNAAAATGNGSLLLNSFQQVVYNNAFNPPEVLIPATGAQAVWDAISPSVDLHTSSAMSLSFDYACASEASQPSDITDSLKIGYSLNCGATWTSIKNITGTSLITAGMCPNFYTPSSASQWQNIVIPITGALNGKSNVRFRFEYVSSVVSNNIYLDNINLNGTVGIDPVSSQEYNLAVYPNPAANEATISYYLPSDQPINIGLYDVTGRQLKELTNETQVTGQHTISLNNDNLSNGIYFIKLVSGNNKSVTKKLIVIK